MNKMTRTTTRTPDAIKKKMSSRRRGRKKINRIYDLGDPSTTPTGTVIIVQKKYSFRWKINRLERKFNETKIIWIIICDLNKYCWNKWQYLEQVYI